MFKFLRNFQIFYNGCTILLSHQQCIRVSIFPPLDIQYIFSIKKKVIAILMCMEWCTTMALINAEHLYMSLLAICISSWKECLFKSFAYF